MSVAKTTPHSDKTNPALGAYKSKNITDSNTKKASQLSFFVDGKEIKYKKEGRIAEIKYENGVEFAVDAPAELIAALENSSKGGLEVHLGDMKLLTISNSIGFSETNRSAYNFCIKSKK
jgi:hypothetical protein